MSNTPIESWGREIERKDQSRVMIDKTKRLEVCQKTASIMAFKLYHNCKTTDSHHVHTQHTSTHTNLFSPTFSCECVFVHFLKGWSLLRSQCLTFSSTFAHQSSRCSLPDTEPRTREQNWQEAKLAAPNLKQIINSRNWNNSFDVLSFISVLTAGCSLRLFYRELCFTASSDSFYLIYFCSSELWETWCVLTSLILFRLIGYVHTVAECGPPQNNLLICDSGLLPGWQCEQPKAHWIWHFQIRFGPVTERKASAM